VGLASDEAVGVFTQLPAVVFPFHGTSRGVLVLTDRRTWFKAGALASMAALGNSWPTSTVAAEQKAAEPGKPGVFEHRGYLGWITDLATDPDPNAAWPSMRLDERLLRDYRESLLTLRRLGFYEVAIWGLYVSRNWPTDIPSAVSPERGASVERLIDEVHRQGLRVLSGLGVYSWGFEEIIRANPKLSRGNAQAMCASDPESWRWMQRVVDFVFERFEIDGVSMQSADQGRCPCEQCKPYSDVEYHALLNIKVAEYIRSRWPKKIIGVNSWGMNLSDPASLPSLIKISKNVDYMTDISDSSRAKDPGYRRKVIEHLACDFGTLGGPQAEPPQHWERDRWFLPTLRRTGDHLLQLSLDGGRACEIFFHILANPGDEVSLSMAGKMLADPTGSWERYVQESVEEAFGASSPTTRDALSELLLNAEDAYFKNLPATYCGTVTLEPLVSSRPGQPVYLTRRLNAQQRSEYRKDLEKLRAAAERIQPSVPRKDKMERVVRCLSRVMEELDQLAQG
jgi:hypothetical protein